MRHKKNVDPSKWSIHDAISCISSNPSMIIAKGAYSIKLPNALVDCSISDESPSPRTVFVLSLIVPVLQARNIAKTDRRDANKSVISIVSTLSKIE